MVHEEDQYQHNGLVDDIMSGLINRNVDATGAYTPMLIANQPSSENMAEALSEEIVHSDAFDMSVAFVSTGALRMLYQDFLDHANTGANPSHIITSTKNHFNDPKTFWQLLHLQEQTGIEIRIWNDDEAEQHNRLPQGAAFHPKGYVFTRRMVNGEPYVNLYVGSSNLTSLALTKQREWNLRISSLVDGGLTNQVRDELASQLEHSEPLTDDWIQQYEEDFHRYAAPRKELLQIQRDQPITPNAMQQEALANLAALRQEGEHRAIIVSATGTGKTYLSAFDVQAYFRNKRGTGRMLYVAQQQQILQSARNSYQKVLGCTDEELGIFSGNSKQSDRRFVFATVQTLSQPDILNQFASDEFDYILFDEVHHAAAPSYKKVMDHFQNADFMLGMTATPERTDGINIFELFGYNIAYEIRLQKALDENMLCPFHYYGVAEYLGEDDESGNAARLDMRHSTNKDKKQLTYEISQLASPERVDYIIKKLEEYGEFHTPVTGIVFCSKVEEAEELSRLFNERYNQQAERHYRTAPVTGRNSQAERNTYIEQLANGELDYLFTVDLFNEGVDIPPVNQIVMLRNTESSIIFTQQLGRGLRKFPSKESCTVIDFIGNYANSYLIPVALYGNTGSRDSSRKNMQRKTIGLSSISFDRIAKERVIKSLDNADWSEMKRLREQYRNVRYELGRIPMLTDIYDYDPSLPYTLASKRNSYYEFVCSAEKSFHGKHDENPFLSEIGTLTETEESILKMATEILVTGLRPQELVILQRLCAFTQERLSNPDEYWEPAGPTTREEITTILGEQFASADLSPIQLNSALRVLDLSYFIAKNQQRFGATPLVITERNGSGTEEYMLNPEFVAMLQQNATFRIFFADSLRVGLRNCRDILAESTAMQRPLDRAFLYDRSYTLWDVMRLCGWKEEQIPQNVGGYKYDIESGTMPIFVKYAASQYEDTFLNRQEMSWFSKNKRTLQSPEFQWIRNDQTLIDEPAHFIPLFVMRAAEAKEGRYYYVGNVAHVADSHEVTKPSGDESVNVVLSTLQLERPLDPELYRHLIGEE